MSFTTPTSRPEPWSLTVGLMGRPRHGDNYAAARLEDYAWLRDEQGLSIQHAAERLQVSKRTAERYERRLREEAA